MRSQPYPGKRLTKLTQVDKALNVAAEARKKSEAQFLDYLKTFWMDIPPPSADPWSPEYRSYWYSVYERLAGKKYTVDNESFDFDVDSHSTNPYPYCTEDYRVVSSQLIGIGNVINALALPPKSSILEMGAGWGNISLFLAQMGYDVTVVDINPRYRELISNRSSALGCSVDTRCIPFENVEDLDRTFDCVLFFESFHHAYNHLKLLDILRKLLGVNGILALAGEPINERLSYDWGLNPAGEALWQIRAHGWFELVFRESYLLRTLKRYGFSVEKHELSGNAVGTTYVCRLRQ